MPRNPVNQDARRSFSKELMFVESRCMTATEELRCSADQLPSRCCGTAVSWFASATALLQETFDLFVGFVTRDGVALLNQAGQLLFVAFFVGIGVDGSPYIASLAMT